MRSIAGGKDDKDDPKKCNRVMRLVPLVGDRFDERAIVLGDGGKDHCEERPPRKTLYFQDPDGNPYEITSYECHLARAEGDA